MFEVAGLRKGTLKFESFFASNWAEAQRFIREMQCEFYNLTVRRIRFA